MKLPNSIQNVVESFEQLPGVGPKTAQRLAFYTLKMPRDQVFRFAEALESIKTDTQICKTCYNVGDNELCEVCNDSSRDSTTLCVVESPLDVLAIEKSGYKGSYHVLHGVMNPIAGVGADEIFVSPLFTRLETLINDDNNLYEKGPRNGQEDGTSTYGSNLNIDTSLNQYADVDQNNTDNADLISDSNDLNISNIRKIQSHIEVIIATGTSVEGESTAMYINREIVNRFNRLIRVTRIGRGLPIGADIEYADERTIGDALEGRVLY